MPSVPDATDSQEPTQPVTMAVPPNITVVLKQDKPVSDSPDWERTARILSLIAIPVVIAVIGAIIQATLSRSTVSRDYVQLSVSILTADKTKTPQELRDWAVDLLDANSPTKFSKDVADRLKGGEINFPGSIAAILSTSNNGAGSAVSPDGKFIAIAQNKEISIWELASGKQVGPPLIGHYDEVTCIAFSPDALTLASGSMDKTVIIWDFLKGTKVSTLRGPTDAVVGVGFTPDGHLIVRSLDRTVSIWDVPTGRQLSKIFLQP
jgi:WD40 repeat protein